MLRGPPPCRTRVWLTASSLLAGSLGSPAASIAQGQGMVRRYAASQRPLSTRPIASSRPDGSAYCRSASLPACSHGESWAYACDVTIRKQMRGAARRRAGDTPSPPSPPARGGGGVHMQLYLLPLPLREGVGGRGCRQRKNAATGFTQPRLPARCPTRSARTHCPARHPPRRSTD